MIARKFRGFDNATAHTEGWELAWYNNRFNVQRCDGSKFDSDDAAQVHVVKEASKGSAYHQTAIDKALASAPPDQRPTPPRSSKPGKK